MAMGTVAKVAPLYLKIQCNWCSAQSDQRPRLNAPQKQERIKKENILCALRAAEIFK